MIAYAGDCRCGVGGVCPFADYFDGFIALFGCAEIYVEEISRHIINRHYFHPGVFCHCGLSVGIYHRVFNHRFFIYRIIGYPVEAVGSYALAP